MPLERYQAHYSYDQKYRKVYYHFYLFQHVNRKCLKLTKMEITRFAMKLIIYKIYIMQMIIHTMCQH